MRYHGLNLPTLTKLETTPSLAQLRGQPGNTTLTYRAQDGLKLCLAI